MSCRSMRLRTRIPASPILLLRKGILTLRRALHDALVSALHAGDADLRRRVTGAKELTRRLLTPSPAH